MNGDMSVAQAGTSFAATAASNQYSLDGWLSFNGAATGVTYSQVAYTGNFKYALRLQRNPGVTTATYWLVTQSFETLDIVKIAGKTMTLSFRARAGADFSASGNALGIQAFYGTGVDGNLATGFTGQALYYEGTVTLTTSDAGYSVTFTVPSNATQLGIVFQLSSTGTAGAADYFDVTGVQLEVGSVATPFEYITYQQNLQRCQRYLPVVSGYALGQAYSSVNALVAVTFPVPPRTPPTGCTVSGSPLAYTASGSSNPATITFANTGTTGAVLNSSTTGLVAGNATLHSIGTVMFTGCRL